MRYFIVFFKGINKHKEPVAGDSIVTLNSFPPRIDLMKAIEKNEKLSFVAITGITEVDLLDKNTWNSASTK